MKKLALVLLLVSAPALAHKASDSYLQLEVQNAAVTGQWDIALRDLHNWIGLDADGDGAITWGELKMARSRLESRLTQRLHLQSGGSPCPLSFTGLHAAQHSDGGYAVFRLRAACAAEIDTLTLRYELLFGRDPTHRGLLKLNFGDGDTQLAIFAPENVQQDFVRGGHSALRSLWRHLREGALHVWTGLDHVLFLAALLLPAVLRREGSRWVVTQSARTAWIEILVVITAFTLAHATTLTLVLLDKVSLPSRWVESLVALTVAFAALNNLMPLVRRRLWLLSFGFGLIHGAAIASVLAALDLTRGNLALALLGFNLGVEGGQLAIVAVWLPLAFALRRKAWYQWGVVGGGSVLVLLIALLWLAERALDLKLLD